MTPERETEIRKQNEVNQSYAVRDLLAAMVQLREASERPCAEDDPCACCRLNGERRSVPNPLPWTVEQDWTWEVYAADGTIVQKFSTPKQAYAVCDAANNPTLPANIQLPVPTDPFEKMLAAEDRAEARFDAAMAEDAEAWEFAVEEAIVEHEKSLAKNPAAIIVASSCDATEIQRWKDDPETASVIDFEPPPGCEKDAGMVHAVYRSIVVDGATHVVVARSELEELASDLSKKADEVDDNSDWECPNEPAYYLYSFSQKVRYLLKDNDAVG